MASIGFDGFNEIQWRNTPPISFDRRVCAMDDQQGQSKWVIEFWFGGGEKTQASRENGDKLPLCLPDCKRDYKI
jgi:hypothetical protein